MLLNSSILEITVVKVRIQLSLEHSLACLCFKFVLLTTSNISIRVFPGPHFENSVSMHCICSTADFSDDRECEELEWGQGGLLCTLTSCYVQAQRHQSPFLSVALGTANPDRLLLINCPQATSVLECVLTGILGHSLALKSKPCFPELFFTLRDLSIASSKHISFDLHQRRDVWARPLAYPNTGMLCSSDCQPSYCCYPLIQFLSS